MEALFQVVRGPLWGPPRSSPNLQIAPEWSDARYGRRADFGTSTPKSSSNRVCPGEGFTPYPWNWEPCAPRDVFLEVSGDAPVASQNARKGNRRRFTFAENAHRQSGAGQRYHAIRRLGRRG